MSGKTSVARPRPALRLSAVLLSGALALAPVSFAAPANAAEDGPRVELSRSEAGVGGKVTVRGEGWPADAVVTLLICGQNMIGGTNACANSDGRAATVSAGGTFRRELPVAEPPEPCPCVVHVATATGGAGSVDAEFTVAGHPVAPLPENSDGGTLSVLTGARLEGSSGVLTFFGAPPERRLVFTVGNTGTAPVKNPVFGVGTSHGVFSPRYEERRYEGTVAPGRRAQVSLPVELAAGAHGEYTVSLRHGGKALAEEPWDVGRPWGVTVFWVLLAVVVPAAVFRAGMAVVDRLRPPSLPVVTGPGPKGPSRLAVGRFAAFTGRFRAGADSVPTGGAGGTAGAGGTGVTGNSRAPYGTSSAPPEARAAPTTSPGTGAAPDVADTGTRVSLPWFAPDSVPGAPAGRASAPAPHSPTAKEET